MAEGLGSVAGGIRGLLELIAHHKEALEFDLIVHGLRLDWLGSESLTWRDLWVMVRHAPPGGAVDRAMNPGDHQWQLPEQLLASIFDALQVANWQRGGGARSAFPKQLDRPGVRPDSKQFGGKPVPMDEMAQWLGWDTSMDGGVTHV